MLSNILRSAAAFGGTPFRLKKCTALGSCRGWIPLGLAGGGASCLGTGPSSGSSSWASDERSECGAAQPVADRRGVAGDRWGGPCESRVTRGLASGVGVASGTWWGSGSSVCIRARTDPLGSYTVRQASTGGQGSLGASSG